MRHPENTQPVYEVKQTQKEALKELQQLFFKGLISFTTMISLQEIYTENLQYKYQNYTKSLSVNLITPTKTIKIIPLKAI